MHGHGIHKVHQHGHLKLDYSISKYSRFESRDFKIEVCEEFLYMFVKHSFSSGYLLVMWPFLWPRSGKEF
jgi:hypothetical protein